MMALKTIWLASGSHPAESKVYCLMEAVAYLAGEAHSDAPECACPVVTKLGVWLNDSCSDALRQELLADLPWRIIGTRSPGAIERQRGFMAADWAVRFVCPILLRRAGLEDHAKILESLPEVTNESTARAASYVAADAARVAALAAHVAALAAHAAVCAAARAARAALAAHAVVCAAARAAAGAAADAAADAADDLEHIQRSCRELLARMIRLTEPQEQVASNESRLTTNQRG